MHDCTTKFSTYPVDLLPLPGRMEDGAASPRGSFDPSKSLDDLAKGIQTLHEQVQNFASAIHSNEPSSPEKKDKSESGPDGLFRRGDRQQIGGAAGGAANGGGGGRGRWDGRAGGGAASAVKGGGGSNGRPHLGRPGNSA
jgi:hypothetical protein